LGKLGAQRAFRAIETIGRDPSQGGLKGENECTVAPSGGTPWKPWKLKGQVKVAGRWGKGVREYRKEKEQVTKNSPRTPTRARYVTKGGGGEVCLGKGGKNIGRKLDFVKGSGVEGRGPPFLKKMVKKTK